MFNVLYVCEFLYFEVVLIGAIGEAHVFLIQYIFCPHPVIETLGGSGDFDGGSLQGRAASDCGVPNQSGLRQVNENARPLYSCEGRLLIRGCAKYIRVFGTKTSTRKNS